MRRQPITFHRAATELISQQRLNSVRRAELLAALESSNPVDLERSTLQGLHELAARGAIGMDTRGLAPGQVRYHLRPGLSLVVVRPPGTPASSLKRFPANSRWPEPPPAEGLRRLLRLHEELLTQDRTALRSPGELVRTLLLEAKDILGVDELAWVKSPEWAAGQDLDPAVLGAPSEPREMEAVFQNGHLALWERLDPVPGAPRRKPGMHTLAAVRSGLPEEPWSGVLEAWSATPGFFRPARLHLLATVAAEFGTLLRQLLRLQQFVFLDALTGLHNRSYYEMHFRHELARAQRDRSPMALVLCDVDDFKSFNTRYGYSGGDAVLQRVSDALRKTVRPFDCVARYGGEEFVIILSPPVIREDARTIAERLRASMEQGQGEVTGLDHQRHNVAVTISVGVAMYPEDAQVEGDLWRKANEAVLRAKSSGKNQVRFWNEA